ncbi:response regulator [Acidobacteria bacterium AB60]|nr:response regulator [Acidobacteria bacterium AB60]
MLRPDHDRQLPAVLLIDDDMVSREVMATMLTLGGFSVHTAESGEESLALLEDPASAPGVILMDTQMPGLSGLPLVRALRAHTAALVYAISASQPHPDLLVQTDGFLLKPFGPEELQRALQAGLPKKPEPSPVQDAPVVDRIKLAELRSAMRESRVRELFEAVIADLHKRHGLIAAAIQQRDAAEVKRLAHAIKGGCGMAGAAQAARVGQLLESRGDDLEYSRSLLPYLREATENLKRMLEAELSPKD